MFLQLVLEADEVGLLLVWLSIDMFTSYPHKNSWLNFSDQPSVNTFVLTHLRHLLGVALDHTHHTFLEILSDRAFFLFSAVPMNTIPIASTAKTMPIGSKKWMPHRKLNP